MKEAINKLCKKCVRGCKQTSLVIVVHCLPIPLNPSTCSDVNRPLVPADCVQPFQSKLSS
jgi:hypothetical protein